MVHSGNEFALNCRDMVVNIANVSDSASIAFHNGDFSLAAF